MIQKLLVLSVCALLAACTPEPNLMTIDQCTRVELFNQCMTRLPAGPNSTKYNDWDEVVGECDKVALSQSYRMKKFVKPECQPGNV